ncbi:hypothetical protein I6A84_08815 [Frankia sp. CNm7]|uniref:Uncharacterized protein n=1 Tax=Frankia nepalensis TaxID=1836974 RepID=A0A937RFQ7_9ACTN|nr:hypothetical protein [Frankia nepalensis]MBL7494857.1 hypothetical protein [Frankia nepalensis]MBL7512211.1 hypothetical protein [Frankia nepalensis]MBL7518212.1 hypothetical protein [Frankia nepalensis]MBL7626574.1 hypothetical protein [Frankia nepalensis]
MNLAIGFDPLSGAPTADLCSGVYLLFPDMVWWLLETVLVLGMAWHVMKPRRVTTAVWLAAVWLLASAARFTPQILPLVAG